MAKIRAGILSKVQGKVGGVVGATWKGKNYLREHVKPSNPNTPAQQLQRGKMSVAVKGASYFLGGVLTRFTNKFVKDMSAYNWFVKQNIALKASQDTKLNDFKLCFGNLPTPAVEGESWAGASGTGILFDAFTLPVPRANTSLVVICAAVMADGSAGAYTITESKTGGTIPGISVALSPEITGDAFYSIALAEVEDFDGANEKVLRCSNTLTISANQ